MASCTQCLYEHRSCHSIPCKGCSNNNEDALQLFFEPKEKPKTVTFSTPVSPRSMHHDTHYQTKVQPIEVMQANMTTEEFQGFLKGNIIKYVMRCGRKDEPLKEAEKVQRYAEWLVRSLKGEKIDPRK